MADKVVTYQQMREASDYIASYWKFSGRKLSSLDFSEKPRDLPKDVSEAWNIHNEFWAEMEEKGIDP